MFDRWPMPSKVEEELRAATRAYGRQGEEDPPDGAVPGRSGRRQRVGPGPEPSGGSEGLLGG